MLTFRRPFIFIVLIVVPFLLYADGVKSGGFFSVSVTPGVHVPSASYMGIGFGTQIRGMYHLGTLPLYGGASLELNRAPSSGVETSADITIAGGAAGAGVYLDMVPVVTPFAGARIGYGTATMNTDEGSDSQGALTWSVGAGIEIPLFSNVALLAQGGVSAHLSTYLSYEAGIGISYRFGSAAESPRKPPEGIQPQPLVAEEEQPDQMEDTASLLLAETVEYTSEDLHLLDAGFGTVFPVFYRYYDENPVGSATLFNAGRRQLEKVEVSVNIPRFMDLPQRQSVSGALDPGESIELDLSVLFNDELLKVTEGTRVAAQIEVSWNDRDEFKSYSVDTVLAVTNRNAMTWDDDRKAASFVTAKDPSILTFAKTVAGIVRVGGRSVVNTNLRTAMAMLEALNLYGIRYVIDPTTPYAELSGNAQAIDFLQFPVQTFQYGAGDCDDLSICYTSNLEAVGVPAAFVTIPGHIYTAFNTGVAENDIGSVFPRPDEVIIHEGQAWIPVEVTILDKGFVEAWKIGARQWRENASRDQAELIPIQEAWQAYEPIGFDLEQRQELDVPDEASLLRAYLTQLEEFIADSIEPQVARIERRIESQGPSARNYNRLGVLYAKYEMNDQAKEWLEKAIETEPYADAYLNRGHMDYLNENYLGALQYYEQAEELDPDNDAVILAISRAEHELENYGYAIAYFEKLESVNPTLADQFGYLQFRGSDAGRASDVALMKSVIVWGEEDEE